MSRKIICVFLFVYIPLSAITLTGIVVDSETDNPLPYANIGLKGTRYGTISNLSGHFVLNIPDEHINEVLSFSYIGFETKELPVLLLLDDKVVRLEQSIVNLMEVTIMPDSTLRSFLRRASRKIPENYTSSNSILSGFFRQTLNDTENSNNLHFIETLIESFKTPYSDRRDGTVKIINSRKYVSEKDFFPSLFYGGTHVAHIQDMVKYRSKVLEGHKNYNYQLSGIINFNNNKVYEIAFTPTEESKSEIQGRLYIDIHSLTFVKIDYEYNQNGLDKRNQSPALRKLNSIERKGTVLYDQYNGRYFLKSAHGSETFQDENERRIISGYEYVTFKIETDNVSNFSYRDQVSEMHIPALEAVDYKKSDWKDYNVLTLPGDVNMVDTIQGFNLLSSKSKRPKSFKQGFANIMRNIEYGINVSWIDFDAPGGDYVMEYGDLDFYKHRNQKHGALLFKTHVGYRINKQFYATYNSAESLDKEFYYKYYYLGGRYYLPLKTIGNQVLLNIDGGLSWQNMGVSLGEERSYQSFSFGGRRLNADKVEAYTGLRGIGFKGGAGLSYQVSSLFHIEVGSNYLHPISMKDVAILSEKSGFLLFRKSAYEELSNTEINYRINDVRQETSGLRLSGWGFSIGMKMMF
ncbi:carboxypeptidase-like regulatory domain-containing protein [Natronoflexus pectinivorans]|uniref:Carboxypeptidase-like protein n=1 Tax=Natronoflexus pectinivorans TaxID=682526 RepID=A0A4R2GIF2_9BACT|nr:carboxypeptidase-like regulatory domain-containing protein [Natronoflexus pectinivorans]TCO08340.1 carboxypeptidase-like protein [Natronoflexus pectinivorans]